MTQKLKRKRLSKKSFGSKKKKIEHKFNNERNKNLEIGTERKHVAKKMSYVAKILITQK